MTRQIELLKLPDNWPTDNLTSMTTYYGMLIIAHPDRTPHVYENKEWKAIRP